MKDVKMHTEEGDMITLRRAPDGKIILDISQRHSCAVGVTLTDREHSTLSYLTRIMIGDRVSVQAPEEPF